MGRKHRRNVGKSAQAGNTHLGACGEEAEAWAELEGLEATPSWAGSGKSAHWPGRSEAGLGLARDWADEGRLAWPARRWGEALTSSVVLLDPGGRRRSSWLSRGQNRRRGEAPVIIAAGLREDEARRRP